MASSTSKATADLELGKQLQSTASCSGLSGKGDAKNAAERNVPSKVSPLPSSPTSPSSHASSLTRVSSDPGSPTSRAGKLKSIARKVFGDKPMVLKWTKDTSKRRTNPAPEAENDAVEDNRDATGSRSLLPLPTVLRPACRNDKERRVSFTMERSEHFEDFTPYCKKYGAHPDDFDLDADGRMVMAGDESEQIDLFAVKAGDTLEFILDTEVKYFSRPQLAAYRLKARGVCLGDQIVVKQRCGEWVQDSIGWLPLLQNRRDAFEIVTPKRKKRTATPRAGVLAVVS